MKVLPPKECFFPARALTFPPSPSVTNSTLHSSYLLKSWSSFTFDLGTVSTDPNPLNYMKILCVFVCIFLGRRSTAFIRLSKGL